METTDSWPRSHHDLIRHYAKQYEEQTGSGEFTPFVYPWGAFGAFVVIGYLLIPHQNRPWLRRLRFVAFAWIAAFAAYCIIYMRARSMAASLGVGLMSAWSVVWIAAILVVNDAQTDFQRIERTEGVFGSSVLNDKTEDGYPHGKSERKENGYTKRVVPNGGQVYNHLGPSKRHGEFAWQPYPLTPFMERLDWVLDIFCNFRGAGWNWRTSALSPPPKWIQEQLHRNSFDPPRHSNKVRPGQTKLYETRREMLVTNAKTLVTAYIILDAIKTLMMHDPYFWGLIDRKPPSYFPVWITQSPVLVRVYRLFLTQMAIKWALQGIFALGPLFFSGLLGPSMLGARAEPWMYPETWGTYDVVLDRGVGGWWSSWWHQTFRFAFEQPSRKLIQIVGMDPRSPIAKLIQLFIAFGLSGFVHASGSYTCAGSTEPIHGPVVFFLLQALGIFLEALVTHSLCKTGIQHRMPRVITRAITFLYVHVWFYFTAPLLANDFARGGVWLFEPIPISPLRGLGFGLEEDGFFCWRGTLASWHSDSRWWRRGVAL
ncbi:hypothetical protein BS50DRAFT_618287 [Corynespora cassiicola Philippines]|uniref:Wax synthase domain-containing protein n=1 Tax=Corynespora cassiicola Philippines TaxID=1448308 RepID=A0A2T2P0K2_CORCC|nr:hypothetical protein BS50DRAFT_618287 [Corynespora cassiicola Philippines]